jgi:hypothetical protein
MGNPLDALWPILTHPGSLTLLGILIFAVVLDWLLNRQTESR